MQGFFSSSLKQHSNFFGNSGSVSRLVMRVVHKIKYLKTIFKRRKMIVMLNEILKTIVQLKTIEEKNPDVKVIIKQLEETVYCQKNKNILDIISVGE